MIAPTISGPDGLRHSIVYCLLYSDLTKGLIFSEFLLLQRHHGIWGNAIILLKYLVEGKSQTHAHIL